MILWRLLPLVGDVAPSSPGGALWFPRELQGTGRHDNPGRYGCLYLSESPMSAVAEALVPFRGTGELSQRMLIRANLPLALAQIDCADDEKVIDLDDPDVLTRTRLRPSRVATKARAVTQAMPHVSSTSIRQRLVCAGGRRWRRALRTSRSTIAPPRSYVSSTSKRSRSSTLPRAKRRICLGSRSSVVLKCNWRQRRACLPN